MNDLGKKQTVEGICGDLRGRLLSGEIRPGGRLVEQELAEEMGISRTPVREALTRLSGEGLLVGVPNVGTFVKQFSVKEVRELFEIREVLEGLAYRKASERMSMDQRGELEELARKTDERRREGHWAETFRTDEDFHGYIIGNCGNDSLVKELEKFSFQTSLIQAQLSPAGGLLRRREITVTHVELAGASGDPLKAERLMREHIAGLAKWLFQSS